MFQNKKILFFRHAESKYSFNASDDHEISLTDKGIRDCYIVAKKLKVFNVVPDLFISSSAKRALETCSILKDSLNSKSEINISPTIYNNNVLSLLKVIKNIDDMFNCILIVGHNPTMQNIANIVNDNNIYLFPPCSFIYCDFYKSKWIEFSFDIINLAKLRINN